MRFFEISHKSHPSRKCSEKEGKKLVILIITSFYHVKYKLSHFYNVSIIFSINI